MRVASALILSSFAIFGCLIKKGESNKNDTVRLQGIRVVTSVSYDGTILPMFAESSAELKKAKPILWTFSVDKYHWVSFSELRPPEEGTFQVDSTKSPKHLDLMPTKGEVLTTQKCIYVLDDDELKVAFSASFSPGSREQEIERAKKMRETRPKSFSPKPEEFTLVVTLKRQKS